MGKPKEEGKIPIKKGIKFVKRANQWCYYEAFNTPSVPDKIEWFDSEEKAKKRLNTILIDN